MGTEKQEQQRLGISTLVSVAKDCLSLLRDGAMFLLMILLVACPSRINSMLIAAGFKEGSVAGFKWQSSLVDSNQSLEEAQAKISELQKEKDEQVKALSEAKAHVTDPTLKAQITKLEKENTTQKVSTGIVQKSVDQTIKANSKLVETAPISYKKSDYLVGLQTLGIADEERKRLNAELSSEGYNLDSITYSYAAGERPAWFSARSTVFYYSASSLPAARELAEFLKAKTGQSFQVQRGSGLGVDPSRKDGTLFVHLIKA
jgi:hypothetical protein